MQYFVKQKRNQPIIFSMKKTLTILLLLFTSFNLLVSAQSKTEVKPSNIVEIVSQKDSVTQATVVIHQDKRIESLLVAKKTDKKDQSVTGYRVQVFSSNQQRTAKNEAFKVEKLIRDQFPTVGVYVNYISPSWKVRVGDFKTNEEATAFRAELIKAFPTLRSQTYIVKEQILPALK